MMSVETIVELSFIQGIIGIKDATADMETAKLVSKQTKPGFIRLSGDDGTYADYLSFGGHGIISVGSHILPEVFNKITELVKSGNIKAAQELQAQYKELIDSLYVESNPIPVKKSLELIGIIESAVLRLPLIEASQATVERLKKNFQQKGLIP